MGLLGLSVYSKKREALRLEGGLRKSTALVVKMANDIEDRLVTAGNRTK